MGARRRRERDEEFTDFVEQASPELLRVGWFLTGEVHAAQDLVQSALLRTYRRWHRIDPPRAVAYTRTVMVNQSRDDWRRRGAGRVSARPDAGEHQPATPDHATTTAEQDRVVRLLRRLPPQQRAVVVLRYYCDLSERDCADELGISTGAVKSAASRGLARLREHLTHEEVTS
ncbi:SigE family RNA polymerase sigma factor [Serinicoccus kebangsaanensis]|uniref:SigE family RNA polymerase sigma factor n=1 Tax=Serinicoccus kebangsaanensis TaxID=2602069 RepID=UPI00124C5E57|nr:SigE family RNA polymerase sigma factor [Serinicoccus kebangsaanensis]